MVTHRGRPMSTQGLLEEAKVQALALRQELEPHDQWEAAALEVAELLIAEERLDEARRLLRQLRRRDLWENERHSEIDAVWRELA
jgi:outer membrane PBP1 activator LpoA protein